MSQHNPDIQPPHQPHPNEAIQPTGPDFVEMPDVVSLPDAHEPLPFWIYLVCGVALFLAGSSFTGFATFGMGLMDQGPGGPAITSNKGAEVAVTDPVLLGKKVYSGNCANCHQSSGEGQPGAYPSLVNSEWVLGSKERLAAIMLHGISGPITVKGASYGTQVMPGWSTVLTDDKIANVLTYLRASWGNTAGPVSADEVSAARDKFGSQTAAFCEADLLKIAPHGPDPTDKK